MGTFILIWAGQLVSLLGSHLSGFAIGIWVYQSSRSVTLFALANLFAQLPGLLLSPFAGALVDRWNLRWTLILSDAMAALGTLALLLLAKSGQLAMWHICVLLALSSLSSAFQVPAHSAMVTVLVPRKHLARAGGMTEMSNGLAQLLAPVLGGVLLGLIHLQGVALVDLLTFVAALATLWISRIPRVAPSEEGLRARSTLLREATFGWSYLRARPPLMGLLIFQSVSNFLVGFVMVLGTPMALHYVSEAKLGALLSVGGVGMICGSLLMAAWGGPRRLILGVLAGQFLGGLSALAGAARPSAILFGIGIFLFLFASPISSSCAQAIWQRKVPADIQGKVFAVRRICIWSGPPLAFLLAGPLSDRVFEPLMAEDGLLAPTIGRILGVGEGRGIALMFALAGLSMILATLWAAMTRLVNVEKDVPDTRADDRSEAAEEEVSRVAAAPL